MGNKKTQISLAYRELKQIPADFVKSNPQVRELDLSDNQISDVRPLFPLEDIEVLVLDQNSISSFSKWPALPKLHTLSINHNSIDNISIFISNIKGLFPNLRFLSLLSNQGCPNFLTGGTPKQYRDYRLYVIYHVPSLTSLDDSKVTEEEVKGAARVYGKQKE